MKRRNTVCLPRTHQHFFEITVMKSASKVKKNNFMISKLSSMRVEKNLNGIFVKQDHFDEEIELK